MEVGTHCFVWSMKLTMLLWQSSFSVNNCANAVSAGSLLLFIAVPPPPIGLFSSVTDEFTCASVIAPPSGPASKSGVPSGKTTSGFWGDGGV